MERAQTLQVGEGQRSDQVDGVPRQSQIHQSRHVDKVAPPHLRDEVVGQPQLDGAPVHVRRHEQETLVCAQRAERLGQVAAHAVEGAGGDNAPGLTCSNQRGQQAACDQSQPVEGGQRGRVGKGSFGRPGTRAVEEVRGGGQGGDEEGADEEDGEDRRREGETFCPLLWVGR